MFVKFNDDLILNTDDIQCVRVGRCEDIIIKKTVPFLKFFSKVTIKHEPSNEYFIKIVLYYSLRGYTYKVNDGSKSDSIKELNRISKLLYKSKK